MSQSSRKAKLLEDKSGKKARALEPRKSETKVHMHVGPFVGAYVTGKKSVT